MRGVIQGAARIGLMAWLGCMLAGSALAAGKKADVVTNPDWLKRPSGEDMAANYPALATYMEIEGRASISCDVKASGTLVGCCVISEAPTGLGFGEAAVKMSAAFQMRPMTVNGNAVDGGTVRIPLNFKLPPADAIAEPPAADTEEGLEQARRLVRAGRFQQLLADGFLGATIKSANDLPETTRTAAMAALRGAVDARAEDVEIALAQAFASVYSADQEREIADFVEKYGRPEQDNSSLRDRLTDVRTQIARATRERAGGIFCAAQACGSPQEILSVWRAIPTDKGRIDNPQWALAPSAFRITRAAPPYASALGVQGAVRLTCVVAKGGALNDCRVDEEAPVRFGFGGAALKLVDQYQLSAIQMDGGALGRDVTVRIGFVPTELPAPPPTSAGGSPRAMALARELVAADATQDTTGRDMELVILNIESNLPKGFDDGVRTDAANALRSGMKAAIDESRDAIARAWAATLSEDALEAIAAFQKSEAGRAFRERQPALEVALQKAGRYAALLFARDARDRFCKERDCLASDVQAPQPSSGTSREANP